MPSRSKRIAVLVDLAEQEQEKALETLGLLRAQAEGDQEQLDSLNQYLQEYIDQINNEGLHLMPVQLQTTQGFIDKLNSAISSQQQKVVEANALLEKAQDAWMEKRSRALAMEKLYEKVKSNEVALLEKQEQKMLDDLAAQEFNKKQHF